MIIVRKHDNKGLCVTMNKYFGSKTLNEYGVQEAKHPFEIKRDSRYIRIDYKQHGVSTGACGPVLTKSLNSRFLRMLKLTLISALN